LEQWQTLRDRELLERGFELGQQAHRVGAGASGNEVSLAGANRGVVVEEQTVDQRGRLGGIVRGVAQPKGNRFQERMGVGDLLGSEAAGGSDRRDRGGGRKREGNEGRLE
jgi:hypothetical protein